MTLTMNKDVISISCVDSNGVSISVNNSCIIDLCYISRFL